MHSKPHPASSRHKSKAVHPTPPPNGAKPGALDPEFPVIGKRPNAGAGTTGVQVNQITLQSDDAIVAAGERVKSALTGSMLVKRYTANGQVDEAFAAAGTAEVSFAGSSASLAYGVTVQADKKIVVVGNANIGQQTVWGLARLNPDGSLDASFGNGGQFTMAIGTSTDQAFSVLQQPDGKLVVGGETWNDTENTIAFAVARFLPDGALDPSFGNAGITIVSVGPQGLSGIRRILLTSAGRIVAVGYAGTLWQTFDFGLAQLNSDGTLDTTFGNQGTLSVSLGEDSAYANDAVLAPGGTIIAAGVSQKRSIGRQTVALAEITSSGSLDLGFGSGGIQVTPIPGCSWNDGMGVVLQADGKILLGSKLGGDPNSGNFAILQYTSSGSLDEEFGNSGVATLAYDALSVANSLAIQSNGKVVGAGFHSPAIEQFGEAMARFFD